MKSVFRKLSLLLGGSSLLFLLSACSKVSGLGYEEGVTSINDHSLSLWQGAWIAAAVVGAITLILIIWPAIFHRHKEGKPEFPKQVQYNIPIEIVYTVVPFIIVSVLFYFTAVKQSAITKLSPDAQVAHTIEVKGIQWSWQFTYPEAGTGANATVTGTPEKWPTLYLPQGQSVRLNFTSNDVVHAFYVPGFMYQMQTLPGVTNRVEFIPKKLGTYEGYCNILCGQSHTYMRFKVKVVTTAEYQSYIDGLKGNVA